MLTKFYEFLSQPMIPWTRIALAVLVIPLGLAFTAPLWRISMVAPQYPQGLSMDVYAYKLAGGNDGQDIKEINVLNHYIGMRDLVEEDFTEFKWMPFAIGGLILFFLRTAVFAKVGNLVDAVALFGYFGLFSLWSFVYKLYHYGHTLGVSALALAAALVLAARGRPHAAAA